MNSKQAYCKEIKADKCAVTPPFSHIYVEREAFSYPKTQQILEKFASATVIVIDDYKDVFCRRGQQYELQHQAQKLILAVKKEHWIYEGAPVCQSFGNTYFYYTSCMMNCVYNCEYCYLKGMYASANVVVFVNLEDCFAQVEQLLEQHEVYLCVSYDTDLLAMEGIAGCTRAWMDFAAKHERLTIEIRTKSANTAFIQKQPVTKHVIFAYTISPQEIIAAYEHGTPSLMQRLACAKAAMDAGWLVRLAFDPMIYCKDWKTVYERMLQTVYDALDVTKLLDVSVGTFRISQDYLKKMRKNQPNSAIVWFPFENEQGVYGYGADLGGRMEDFLVCRLEEKIDKNRIFLWR